MKKISLIAVGVLVSVVGTALTPFLIDTVGLTEACSGEVSGWILKMIPVAIGAVLSWIGAVKSDAMTTFGAKK
jgi:hypothetical protein